MKNPIIVLTGPTASGKSAISLEIADRYNCEIICADSMTVYRGMDIGTDKPTLDIENIESRIKNKDGAYLIHNTQYHMLDIVDPDEEFNVSIFCEKVKELVTDIHARGNIPMLVGGSVMYIDAYVYDYQIPEVAPNQALRDQLDGKTNEELFSQLCDCDPDCEWTVDRHNKRRLIRAIEVCTETGKPFSSAKAKMPFPDNVLYLAVDREREVLYSQIDKRVDVMFRQGFVDEVRELHKIYDHNTAMQAAGYRQIIQCIDGEIDLDTAIARTKQVHRNYAKRQLTWLRKNPDVKWIRSSDETERLIKDFLL